MVVLVDQFTRFLWAYPITLKGDATDVLKKWHLYARNQAQTELKVFRTDRGGEFLGKELNDWWAQFGVDMTTHWQTAHNRMDWQRGTTRPSWLS